MDAKRGIVDKLQYAFTGPWRVTAVLTGASYELEHCDHKRKDKKHASDLSPYPVELILFQPIDGADTCYGQLYKPISADPFKEAGIKGFDPIQPYKVSSNFAITSQCAAFHWPSLYELNDEFAPFPWANDAKFQQYLHRYCVTKLPVLAMGPPPADPIHSIPKTPAIHLLTAAIINSVDRLFFVSHSIGAKKSREWRLVQISFSNLMLLYPSCMLDEKFLFEFYICHPSDWRYNAVNHHYWIQYHGQNDINCPTLSLETHLILPSDTLVDYALFHKLLPFRKWLNITHSDTFIYGPFELATVKGQKTRDCISQDNWNVLL